MKSIIAAKRSNDPVKHLHSAFAQVIRGIDDPDVLNQAEDCINDLKKICREQREYNANKWLAGKERVYSSRNSWEPIQKEILKFLKTQRGNPDGCRSSEIKAAIKSVIPANWVNPGVYFSFVLSDMVKKRLIKKLGQAAGTVYFPV